MCEYEDDASEPLFTLDSGYVPDTKQWHVYVSHRERPIIGASGADEKAALKALAAVPHPQVLLEGEAEALEAYARVAEKLANR